MALWPRRTLEAKASIQTYVQRLRIYPHALREPNAYYSPAKKALLFGYFKAPSEHAAHAGRRRVHLPVLRHHRARDGHAILDGIHAATSSPQTPMSWPLHEAFADIVALFQQFTIEELLAHQVERLQGGCRPKMRRSPKRARSSAISRASSGWRLAAAKRCAGSPAPPRSAGDRAGP